MADLNNARNVRLYSSSVRVTGAVVSIDAGPLTSIIFPKNQTVTVPVPSSANLTAIATGYITPLYTWSYRFGNTGTYIALASTTSTQAFTLDNAFYNLAELKTGDARNLVQFKVVVTETASNLGVNQAEATLSVPIIREATNYTKVSLYARTGTAAAPTLSTTGSFTYNFTDASIVGQPSGWSKAVPSESLGAYLWVTEASVAALEQSKSFANTLWSSPTIYARSGTDAVNTALVYAYKRSVEAPTDNPGSVTFDFTTGSISTTTLANSWSKTMPGSVQDGTSLWVVVAPASSTGTTDTVTEWGAPVKFVENGLNTATVYLYARNNSTLTAPTVDPAGSTTYTFSTAQLSTTAPNVVPSGWSQTLPLESAGSVLWVIQAVASSTASTATIANASAWTPARVLSVKGADGAVGVRGTRQIYSASTSYNSTYQYNGSTAIGPTSYAVKASELVTSAATAANSVPAAPIAGDTVTFSNNVTSTFTGTLAGYVLTVTSVSNGAVQVGQSLTGAGILTGTTVTGFISGTNGGAGQYAISRAQTVSSATTITATLGDYVYTITYDGTAWKTPGTVVDGSLLVTGSVTAAKINTNGLEIRDADGTLILGAGSSNNLDFSRIGGTTKPADNANKTYVDTAGNIQGVSSGAGLSVANNIDSVIRSPGGGIFTTSVATHTGRLKITLPQSWTNTMMRFTIEIYEYQAGYMCTTEVGGYNYAPTPAWYNVSARVIGGSNVEYPVYFGHDGTKCCIWIGSSTIDTWSYPQVRIRDFFAGYSNALRTQWESGWGISFDQTALVSVSSHSGANQYSASVVDTLPGADWAKISGTNKPENGATRNVYRGNWVTATAYAVGDTVIYGGYGWSCKVAHTSSATVLPPTYPVESNTQWTLAAVKGTDAKLVYLTSSSYVVTVNSSGTLSPTAITLDALGQAVSGSPVFTVDSGSVALTGTGNSRTIDTASLTTDQAKIRVTWDGLVDVVTITKVKEGFDSITVVVSNEAHVMPAAVDGTVSNYTNSGTTIQVYEGNTLLTASSTATTGAFRVGAITQVPASTLTVGGISYSGTVATIAQHSAMAVGQDTVALTIPITVYRANGTSVTYSKVQTITKSKTGATGATGATGISGLNFSEAKSLFLDPTFQTSTNSVSVYNNAGGGTVTITREAKQSDSPFADSGFNLKISNTGTASPGIGGFINSFTGRASAVFVQRFVAKIPVGYTLADATNAMGDGYTATWLTSKAGTGKFEEYILVRKCGATGSFSGSGHIYLLGAAGTPAAPINWYLAYSAAYDFSSVGFASVVAALSNDSHAIPTDSTGNNGIYTGAVSTITIYNGTTDDSANWTVTAVPSTGVTGSLSGRTYTVSALTVDTGYVDFTATRSGYASVTKRFTVTKAKAGVQGVQGPAVSITASRSATFTATDGGLDANQADIVYTAAVSGITSPTYVWTFTGFQTAPTASTTNTQTITAAQFGTAKSATVTCTVSGTYKDSETIIRLEKSTAAANATSGSNLVKKSTFEDGQPGSWDYAGIENRINAGMPYAKNIYFHARENLEQDAGFAVSPGEIFYAAGWLETLGITSYSCYIGLKVVDAAGAVVTNGWLNIASIGPNTAWKYVKGSAVIPADGVKAFPRIFMDGFDFPAGNQWVRAAGLYIGRHEPGASYGANSSNLAVGLGVNTIPNSNFLNGSLEGWSKGELYPGYVWGTNLSSSWELEGNESTAYIQQTTGYTANWIGDIYATKVPVIENARYEAYAYTGAHRAQLQVIIAWYHTLGWEISQSVVGTNDEEWAGGSKLSGYKKTGGFAYAPAGAATAMLFVRKYSTKNITGYNNSFAFIARAFFGEALPGQTELSPWSPGQVQSVRSLGYTGDLNATNGATADQVTALNNKLNKSADDIITGSVKLSSQSAIWFGNGATLDTNNGVYIGSGGLVGRKNGSATFALSTDGSLTISQANVINTLQIQDQAVTIPVGVSQPPGLISIPGDNSLTEVISASIVSTGAKILVNFSAEFSGTSWFEGGIAQLSTTFHIDRVDSAGNYLSNVAIITVIHEEASGSYQNSISKSAGGAYFFVDQPGAGARYYKVKAQVWGQGASNGTHYVRLAAMSLLEVKK